LRRRTGSGGHHHSRILVKSKNLDNGPITQITTQPSAFEEYGMSANDMASSYVYQNQFEKYMKRLRDNEKKINIQETGS